MRYEALKDRPRAPRKILKIRAASLISFAALNLFISAALCWLFFPDTIGFLRLPAARAVPYLGRALYIENGFTDKGLLMVIFALAAVELLAVLSLISGKTAAPGEISKAGNPPDAPAKSGPESNDTVIHG
jgi:hypothetical protein